MNTISPNSTLFKVLSKMHRKEYRVLNCPRGVDDNPVTTL